MMEMLGGGFIRYCGWVLTKAVICLCWSDKKLGKWQEKVLVSNDVLIYMEDGWGTASGARMYRNVAMLRCAEKTHHLFLAEHMQAGPPLLVRISA